MKAMLTVLGVESSCDDTSVAVVRGMSEGPGEILSNEVAGQAALHSNYGGVVPEIAARAHTEKLDAVAEAALIRAGVSLGDVDAIAATAGPGLIGGVLSGLMFAKGLAAGARKPLVAVNHLAGHALTPRLTEGLSYPYLMLLISGGHCQFLKVEAHDRFRRLGGTIDDAPGEAFDKTAILLGLGFPGGPAVEAAAKRGDPDRFDLPRPLLDRPDCNMSFSGLKTAVRRQLDQLNQKGAVNDLDRSDLCASFQQAVADVLREKTRRALAASGASGASCLAVAGGVAANATIRRALEELTIECETSLSLAPLRLCTDNAAMIAWAGLEAFAGGKSDGLDVAARPRWPLDKEAPPMLGSGKKGAKA